MFRKCVRAKSIITGCVVTIGRETTDVASRRFFECFYFGMNYDKNNDQSGICHVTRLKQLRCRLNHCEYAAGLSMTS